ncbi:YihY/virulence factor BrkB family protein [Actinocrinis puniceicyclus]|uniref:YihY/virulence factor BrkB family protein n=1 Tax=Actinocrinis puniceicyclus TaxID=977794 RepID=A0A8J7WLS9_9ACTN|nr:YihY/virulence factor BrkB family protein [Actinocrinis puniceicyclus]MBS2963185.1 YihY/virulence factor BrkB family protein [Actinocrinis puniceicyclus]
MPKLHAPNGRIVLLGPGTGDEVTQIDPSNVSVRGTAPEQDAASGDAGPGDDAPAGRHHPHRLLHGGHHQHNPDFPDEIAGIEKHGALIDRAGKPTAGPGTRAGAADAPPAGAGRPQSATEPPPAIVAESVIAAEAVMGGGGPAAPGTWHPGEQAPQQPRAGALRRTYRLVRELVTETYRRGVEIELMHRAFGFAALGFVTLVPLLIVVAAAAPLNGRTFPEWAIAGLGLSGRAAKAVNGLFGPTAKVLSTTTALSVAVLAVFGLSFVSVVQTGMARVWELPAARLLSVWRQAIWLAMLVGLLLVGADLVAFLQGGWFVTTVRWCATAGGSLVFFWWTQHFLLESRVPWRALLPGAVLTVAGLVGLRLFSALIFGPMIVSSALTYGSIGAVLIVVSWLIGIGYVIIGAALVGRVIYDTWGGGRA